MTRVADLLADLLALPNSQGTPANPAKVAKTAANTGPAADFDACEGLRKPANPEPDAPADARKFAEFADVRNEEKLAQPMDSCGSSQDSQLSQGYMRASQPAAGWREASTAYMAHHACCRVCIASGLGYGARCSTGARLWASCIEACAADRTAWPGRLPVIRRTG